MRKYLLQWTLSFIIVIGGSHVQAQEGSKPPPGINSQDPFTAIVGPTFGYTMTGNREIFRSIAGKPQTLYFPFGGGLANPEDDGYANLELPFNFKFFNNILPAGNPLFASANGFLVFGTSSTTVVPTNLLKDPASFGNQPAISPMFGDLVARGMQSGGPGLYAQLTGTPGNQKYTIEWSSMQDYNNGQPSGVVSFQVQLFESDGRMNFNYDSTLFGTQADRGGMSVTGIRDTTFSDPPTNAVQWGFMPGTAEGEGIHLGDSDFQIMFNNFAAVPEPTSIALVALSGTGFLATTWYRRRKNHRRTSAR